MYFGDDTIKYSPAKLGIPEVTYIHPYYLDKPQICTSEAAEDLKEIWMEWLSEAVGIREQL